MTSYFNLTLDTTAPSGVTVKINGDEEKTSSTSAVLTIACGDADTTGYQMKIWGTATAQSESQAQWENFATEKSVTLSAANGIKTIYVKVRDDVWNESAAASDTIRLDTTVPIVEIMGPDVAKISKISGKNASVFRFTVGTLTSGAYADTSEFKVMVVENINAAHDSATNKPIPIAGGSKFTVDEGRFTPDGTYLAGTNGNLFDGNDVAITICGEDLEAASPGDGAKIVKVFARASSGLWSV